ncbi:uncharacterized protein LOC133206329 [Saccostrea echinata]|uniref:uncharacterized protein LOC133206329 n=1 Tax=Saccostrea echinata TaxID=191078 RepID=UPI002A7F2BEE|nr:uncharacterized protein LOC133206329 [Saccostrea echinata]
MQFHYCTMDPHRSTSTKQWSKGNYCIMRNGPSCPEGFHQGSVFWDDEDEKNSNRQEGTLPSGSFTRDTLINYCCRNDGSFRNRIILPTNKPFYLLRFRSLCERVQEMYVREEIVHFDDEDSNNRNTVSGWYPLGAGGRDQNLHYCYYSP